MKLSLKLFSLFLLIHCVSFAQNSGGPDKYGYHWANSMDALGTPYNWKDIKDTANLVTGLGDDNSSGAIDMDFYYNYYGQYYNTIWIGTNGWVAFNPTGNISAPFPSIPAVGASDNYVAALLSDLTLKGANDSAVPGAAVYFWSNKIDSAIIQFDSVPFWDTSALGYSGRNTFQIILAGAEYSIKLQYKELINSIPAYNFANFGLRIGIEDSTGQDGLLVMSDTFPPDSLAIKFFSPGTFSVNEFNLQPIVLGQNFPNPAMAGTTINYTLLETGQARLAIHNIRGALLKTFNLGLLSKGEHQVLLETKNYSNGVYFYTLSVNNVHATRRMLIQN